MTLYVTTDKEHWKKQQSQYQQDCLLNKWLSDEHLLRGNISSLWFDRKECIVLPNCWTSLLQWWSFDWSKWFNDPADKSLFMEWLLKEPKGYRKQAIIAHRLFWWHYEQFCLKPSSHNAQRQRHSQEASIRWQKVSMYVLGKQSQQLATGLYQADLV